MMRGQSITNILMVVSFALSCSFVANAQVAAETPAVNESIMAPRQLLVLKPGLDEVYGTWVAAVNNKSKTPQHVRVSALIPRETIDVHPLEGVANGEWKLDQTGLWIEKEFGEGVNVISFSFRTAARYGANTLNFKVGSPIDELILMTPSGMMTIAGRDLVVTGSDMQGSQGYTVMTVQRKIVAGDAVAFDIDGVPEGRGRLWIVGAAFGILMVVGAAVMVRRTRIKSSASEI
jgi:hypothetical protein